jgi:Ni/Co efflux regulator RcnB
MKRMKVKPVIAVLVAGVLVAGTFLADTVRRTGPSEGSIVERHDRAQGGVHDQRHRYFTEQQRVIVREYFGGQFRANGRCPPGLAKKHDRCTPEGQSRKWEYGRPISSETIFYGMPESLVVQIGLPPPGHRYVRVAGDILMIAEGGGIVIDAIQELGS